MERTTSIDMRVKLRKLFYYFILFSITFILYKLIVINTEINKLQVLKEALQIHKEQLQLTQQQLLLLEHLESNTGNTNTNNNIHSLPTIYAITPTYWRYVQKAELTRISQTLKLVPNVHWLVVEDGDEKSDLVRNLVFESGVVTTHLNAKTPSNPKLHDKDPRWKAHRGVNQRNTALQWLRDNLKPNEGKGVVYFMDDDNTYSVKLFAEIAKVKRVGVWPVGLVGGLNAETPIVNKNGQVSGYKSGWKPNRPFAIDMAGFAINLDLILTKTEAKFSNQMEHGLQESEFLSYFTTKEQLEPLADNCTKVYVWHTRTEKPTVNGIIPGLEV